MINRLIGITAILSACILINPTFSESQDKQDSLLQDNVGSLQSKQFSIVSLEISNALHANQPEGLVKHCSRKIYLNLKGSTAGFFSLNQAHYIIREFFEKNILADIHITKHPESAEEIFISATASLHHRNKIEKVKIYIGFLVEQQSYLITQLTIN